MSLHDIWKGDVMPESGVTVAIGRNSFDPPASPVPLYDVHSRSLIYHDTDGSGILFHNSQLERLQLIPNNSGVAGVQCAVWFNAYQSSATAIGTAISGPNSVALDTVRAQSSSLHFQRDFGNTIVVIFASGTFQADYLVTCDQDTNTRRNYIAWLEFSEPNGSLVTIPGSTSYGYLRNSANPEQTVFGSVVIENVRPGSIIRVRTALNLAIPPATGTYTFRANSCALKLLRLE
jgi:hypothetical protein